MAAWKAEKLESGGYIIAKPYQDVGKIFVKATPEQVQVIVDALNNTTNEPGTTGTDWLYACAQLQFLADALGMEID